MSALQRNNVSVLGRGATALVFAHGFGCDQNMWRFVAPAFTERYRVVLFDHVGAGNSDASSYDFDAYSSLDRYAEDVLEIVDELELNDVVFIGHSVSAMIGVLAANKKPGRFAKLVLIAPSPCYLNQPGYVGGFERVSVDNMLAFLDANFSAWANMMAPTIMGNLDRPELGSELTTSFCRLDPAIARQFARVTFLSDNRADLDALKAPTLILQCSQDPLAPESVGQYMHARLENSSLIELSASGHCPNMSAPQETIDAITTFL